MAGSHATLLYDKGIKRGQDWIRSCGTVYLYAAQEMLTFLVATSQDIQDSRSQRIMKVAQGQLGRTIAAKESAAEENAYKIAWGIHHGFKRTVKAIGTPA